MLNNINLDNAVLGIPLLESEPFEASDYLDKPENDYCSIEDIVSFIKERDKSINIPSNSLRVNGDLVQDSFEKYLSATDYNSSSFLKKALYTPRHYFFEKEYNPELREFKNNKSFNLGTFIHQAVLEPTKFSRVFVEPSIEGVNANSTKHWENLAFSWYDHVHQNSIIEQNNQDEHTFFQDVMNSILEPEKDLKRGDYKDYVTLIKGKTGIESISQEDFIKIKAFKSIYDSYGGGIIPLLLKHSKREVSVYSKDEETGLNVRVRPDAMQFKENIGANVVISVKSTSSENLDKFFYDCAKYHYDLSESMYLDVCSNVTGRDFDGVITIMVQTVEPFGIAVIMWTPEDLAVGKYKYRYALDNVINFEKTGIKSSYDTYSESGNMGMIQSKLPDWNKKELKPRNF